MRCQRKSLTRSRWPVSLVAQIIPAILYVGQVLGRAIRQTPTHLWVGDQATVNPAAVSLLSIPASASITSLAADPGSGSVWIGQVNGLSKYLFDGTLAFSKSLTFFAEGSF